MPRTAGKPAQPLTPQAAAAKILRMLMQYAPEKRARILAAVAASLALDDGPAPLLQGGSDLRLVDSGGGAAQ